MYQLQVFYPFDPAARRTVSVRSAAEVMELVSDLLAEHPGCERIVVLVQGVRLFSVDCHGHRGP